MQQESIELIRFPDFSLAVGVLVQENIPDRQFQMQRGQSRSIVVLHWLICGYILSMGYCATLLSVMISIRYEDTIDNINDLDISGMPILFGPDTPMGQIVLKDPRPAMRRINNVTKPIPGVKDLESVEASVKWYISQ